MFHSVNHINCLAMMLNKPMIKVFEFIIVIPYDSVKNFFTYYIISNLSRISDLIERNEKIQWLLDEKEKVNSALHTTIEKIVCRKFSIKSLFFLNRNLRYAFCCELCVCNV